MTHNLTQRVTAIDINESHSRLIVFVEGAMLYPQELAEATFDGTNWLAIDHHQDLTDEDGDVTIVMSPDVYVAARRIASP